VSKSLCSRHASLTENEGNIKNLKVLVGENILESWFISWKRSAEF
jgi:hypothetical protein